MASPRRWTSAVASGAVALLCLAAFGHNPLTRPAGPRTAAAVSGLADGARPADGDRVPIAAEGVGYAIGRRLDVYRPPTAAPRGIGARPPVVVLVHGCCGDRSDLSKLAQAIAAAGAVVFDADWAGLGTGAHYPGAYEDVACAVRYARARAADLGADPGRIVLAGWADGAMVASVVGSGDGRLSPARCRYPASSALPDAVVGINGFYGWTLPVPSEYVTPRSVAFFGGTPREAPSAWRAATPYTWLARSTGRPRLEIRLLVGASDPLLADARRYAAALTSAGQRVRLLVVPPAGDQTLISPRTAEGRTTVAEVIAAAGAG